MARTAKKSKSSAKTAKKAKSTAKASAKNSLEKMVRNSAKQVRKPSIKKQPAKKDPQQSFKKLHDIIKEQGKTVQKIPLAMISISENIRQAYDDSRLDVLAQSLEKDGLIQYPSVCLKKDENKGYYLICRNGHRRILAAQKLGWQTIDAVVMSLENATDELYYTINANLSEDVYYLDIAKAYQRAAHLGESDQDIADRVGVNYRTVGWYRRLAAMPASCEELARKHPDVFTPTWAIQIARKGDLPQETLLLAQMKEMLSRVARQGASSENTASQKTKLKQRREMKKQLKERFSEMSDGEKSVYQNLFKDLALGGFLSPKALASIEKQLLGTNIKTRNARSQSL